MQIDIQGLAALVGLGLLVWLVIRMAKKAPPVTPVVPGEIPVEQPKRLPRWHGFFLWMPVLQQGGFEHLRTNYSTQGSCPTDERRYGIEDNFTGPYQVQITARHRGTGWVNPIYSETTHEDVTGKWVPSGAFYWYPLAVRPWQTTEMGGCGVPTDNAKEGPPELRFGTETQYIDISIRIANALGDVSEEIPGVIPVAPHFCDEEAKKKTKR